MIELDAFRALLKHLGFIQDHSAVSAIWRKHFAHDDFELVVDFNKQEIVYPEGKGFKVHQRQTCNFSASENAVVFECVHRLFAKGYKPEHIELEPEWTLGHGQKGGRADILVRNQQDAALLIIECKTAGREFDKAWKDTLADGAQLFSYVEQEKATQFVCLYASGWDDKAQNLVNSQRIISVKDNPKILEDNPKALAFNAATNAKERFRVWKETYQQETTENGIFEDNIQAYHIGKNKYTLADDTKPLAAIDIKGAYHRFRTVLRKHNVSRRENAFEVLVNLFLCKIVDELENPLDLKFYWKGIAYDNYFDLVDRLQSLYKIGMERFLGQDIVYISNEAIDEAFWAIKQKPNATQTRIKEIFRELKFYKGLDFEFIKVFNKTYFDKNAKILLEIIQLWQSLRLTGSAQNQFLGDMFEYFLDNGIKQSEGQFFTPVPICKFVVSSLPLEQLIAHHSEPLRAIDYACGSGHFLTEYAQQIPPLLQSIKQIDDPTHYYRQVYGVEKEDRLAKVAKVSAFMYGFKEIQVIDADALMPHAAIKEQGFQVLVANPPFAVEDFLLTVPEQDRERFDLLRTVSDLGNKNIQCFFLERAMQLLSPGGVMGVIVPSSILSNTDGMHIATREILLKHFDVASIAELGGQTFGKTGTNTVVLFLRRKKQRPEPAEHYLQRTQRFFNHWNDELASGGGAYLDLDVVQHYCQHVGLDYAAYQSLLLGQPDTHLLQTPIFKDYKRVFEASNEVKKIKDKKDFQRQSKDSQETELAQRLAQYCRDIEQKKLYFYMLAYNNPTPVLIVKPPADNKAQKQFLGYEWSGAKGSEGIQYGHGETVQDIQTPLFDPLDRNNVQKISYLLRQNFEGQTVAIPDALAPYVTRSSLVDLLDFSRVEFDRQINLTPKADTKIVSQWPLVKLEDLMAIGRGASPRPIDKFLTTDANGISWVKIGDVRPGEKYLVQTAERITPEGAAMSRPVAVGDFILSNSMSFGRPYIMKINGCIHDGWLLLSQIDHRLDKDFLYEILTSEIAQNQFTQSAAGGVVQNLNTERVRSVKIPVPTLVVQQSIVAECASVDKDIEAAKIIIETASKNINDKYAEMVTAAAREVRMNDGAVFELMIGKRVLKNEINDVGIGLPVMSANVKEAFGFTDKQLLPKFDTPSVIWGIDGDWMVNFVPENKPFYPTDHCGVVRINSTEIHPRYFAAAFEEEGKRVRFSRSNRASMEAIKGLKFRVPPMQVQLDFANVVENSENMMLLAQTTIAAAPAKKQAILAKYL